MSIKDQIRAEIERIRSEAVMASFGNETDWLRSRVATCVDILAFLDTLPEQPDGLEEEIAGMYQALFGTDIINRKEMVYLETFNAIARHFADWGAEHTKQKPADDKAFEEWLDDWYQGSKETGGDVVMSEAEFKNWSRGIKNMYQQKPAWGDEQNT